MLTNNKSVSIVRCNDYDRKNVIDGVNKAIGLIGSVEKFVDPGQKVVVKPNLLRPAAINKHVTTHPEVVFAVCKLFKDFGCKVMIAESPGAGASYSERALRRSYRAACLDKIADELSIELNYGLGYRYVSNPKGRIIKGFNIIEAVLDADAIINVCKMKTHLLTYTTGATKNMFGVIPGIEKATFHSRLNKPDDFSEMLIDLTELIKPKLNVMDAIIAMEGNGPNGGETRNVGALLASESPTAMDAVEARLMSIDPNDVGVIKSAMNRKILRKDLTDVAIVGENIETVIVKDFKKPKTYPNHASKQGRAWTAMGSAIRSYALRPTVDKQKCIGCKECFNICSQKAITMKDDKAQIDYSKCIRCYCCHETCSNDAISLRRSLPGKIVKKIVR